MLVDLNGGLIVHVDAEIQLVMSGPIMGLSHGESTYKVVQPITPIEADSCNGVLLSSLDVWYRNCTQGFGRST